MLTPHQRQKREDFASGEAEKNRRKKKEGKKNYFQNKTALQKKGGATDGVFHSAAPLNQ